MSGGRSPPSVPGRAAAGAPGGAGAGTAAGTARGRARPGAKIWLRIWASSWASVCFTGMIWSSSSATSTSTSLTMSSSRRMLAAESVMMSRFVSRWGIRLPRADISGLSRPDSSATEAKRIGTIWVMISSPTRPGSGAAPTTVGTGRSRAPSSLMIL